MSSAPTTEHVIMQNLFGTVTDIAVHYNVRKGLLAGISQETLPIRHVTAVRLETTRHWIWGGLLGLIGLALLASKGAGIIGGIILVAIAVLLIWGWPKVMVNTAGGDMRPSVSWPWTRTEADEFVGALRNELIKRG